MEEGTMTDHRVVILCDRAKVVPAVLIVGEDDAVSFEIYGTRVEVTFHCTNVPLVSARVELDSERPVSQALKVIGKPGVYPYSVWCCGPAQRSAQGDSDPIIIIKRPSST